MDRLHRESNRQTVQGDLEVLIKYYLIANASQTRIFKGNKYKIYSFKKTLSNGNYDTVVAEIEEELSEYLSVYFDFVEVKALDVSSSKWDERSENKSGMRIQLDITASRDINNVPHRAELSSVMTEKSMSDLFRYKVIGG